MLSSFVCVNFILTSFFKVKIIGTFFSKSKKNQSNDSKLQEVDLYSAQQIQVLSRTLADKNNTISALEAKLVQSGKSGNSTKKETVVIEVDQLSESGNEFITSGTSQSSQLNNKPDKPEVVQPSAKDFTLPTTSTSELKKEKIKVVQPSIGDFTFLTKSIANLTKEMNDLKQEKTKADQDRLKAEQDREEAKQEKQRLIEERKELIEERKTLLSNYQELLKQLKLSEGRNEVLIKENQGFKEKINEQVQSLQKSHSVLLEFVSFCGETKSNLFKHKEKYINFFSGQVLVLSGIVGSLQYQKRNIESQLENTRLELKNLGYINKTSKSKILENSIDMLTKECERIFAEEERYTSEIKKLENDKKNSIQEIDNQIKSCEEQEMKTRKDIAEIFGDKSVLPRTVSEILTEYEKNHPLISVGVN